MDKVKSIVIDQGYEHYKATIGKAFITIRKTLIVPSSELDAKWLRKHFYSVRKIGKFTSCKTQAYLMIKPAEAMKTCLIEKDGRFYLSDNAVFDERMNIHMYSPDKENPKFESVIKVNNGLSLTISTGVRNIPIRGRKQKKKYKRVFWDASMDGKHTMRLQQLMIINAYAMRAMLDLLDGNIETGFYFDLSKVKQEERMI